MASRTNIPEDDSGANMGGLSSVDGFDLEGLGVANDHGNASVEGVASDTSSGNATSQPSLGSQWPSPSACPGLIARFIAAYGADDALSRLCQEYPWQ